MGLNRMSCEETVYVEFLSTYSATFPTVCSFSTFNLYVDQMIQYILVQKCVDLLRKCLLDKNGQAGCQKFGKEATKKSKLI